MISVYSENATHCIDCHAWIPTRGYPAGLLDFAVQLKWWTYGEPDPTRLNQYPLALRLTISKTQVRISMMRKKKAIALRTRSTRSLPLL